MTTAKQLSRALEQVKSDLVAGFGKCVDSFFECMEAGASPRALEVAAWEAILPMGRAFLAKALGALCQQSTQADIQRRGLGPQQARLRLERDNWATITTTFGCVAFPLFAYRDTSGPHSVMRTPARREVLPLLARCRASELCIEWEARLGAAMPFRRAQEDLAFFSHGAVEQHDTTIASHMVAVGCAVDRDWLYRPVTEIRDLLVNRAKLDKKTGRPVVYVSSDAHAERRYVDGTWNAAWKMVNGIRLWIVDRVTGGIIHLGGEFTWGDCHEVGRITDALVERGVLPRGGDYGDGLVALVVVVTDGCPWLEEYVLGKLPWSIPVLDLYHALERVGIFAAKCFGASTKAARAFYRRVTQWLAPRSGKAAARPKQRRGHKNQRRQAEGNPKPPKKRVFYTGWCLLGALYEEKDNIPEHAAAAFETLLDYFEHNTYRMAYKDYEARGLQVGSGAMESLNRIAQLRLKIQGGRWLKETSTAIFNLRMLHFVGRWDEFWNHSGITDLLVQAFEQRREAVQQRNAA